MDKGKGKATAVPIPTTGGVSKLPVKFYCGMGSGCLHAIANAVAKGTFGPSRIMARQIKTRTALQNPAAWVACGHVCCWEPIVGCRLPEGENTCAKLHAQQCQNRGSRLSYKEAMTRAVAEGLVPVAWLALADLTEVGVVGRHAGTWQGTQSSTLLTLQCTQGASSSAAAGNAAIPPSPSTVPQFPTASAATPPILPTTVRHMGVCVEPDHPASPFSDEDGDSLPEIGAEDEDEDSSGSSDSGGDEDGDKDEDEDEDEEGGSGGAAGVTGRKRKLSSVDLCMEENPDDDRESDAWSQPWSDTFSDVKDDTSDEEYNRPEVKAHEQEPIPEVSELLRTFYTR